MTKLIKRLDRGEGDFLKEVFAGQKQLLKKAAVVTVQVPYYDELSVKRLWPELKKNGNGGKGLNMH